MLLICLSAAALSVLLALARRRLAQQQNAQHLREQALQERVESLESQLQAIEPHLLELDRAGREQITLSLVLGNLLVDKGLVEEAEIEDAHRRLVVEPALMREEHDALLEDLPDPETLRARLVRNLPGTLQ